LESSCHEFLLVCASPSLVAISGTQYRGRLNAGVGAHSVQEIGN
jgi:hypothetical protein